MYWLKIVLDLVRLKNEKNFTSPSAMVQFQLDLYLNPLYELIRTTSQSIQQIGLLNELDRFMIKVTP